MIKIVSNNNSNRNRNPITKTRLPITRTLHRDKIIKTLILSPTLVNKSKIRQTNKRNVGQVLSTIRMDMKMDFSTL